MHPACHDLGRYLSRGLHQGTHAGSVWCCVCHARLPTRVVQVRQVPDPGRIRPRSSGPEYPQPRPPHQPTERAGRTCVVNSPAHAGRWWVAVVNSHCLPGKLAEPASYVKVERKQNVLALSSCNFGHGLYKKKKKKEEAIQANTSERGYCQTGRDNGMHFICAGRCAERCGSEEQLQTKATSLAGQ